MRQILVAILFLIPYFLSGQTSFQYEAEEDTPLAKVITSISEEYNIQFAYPSALSKDIIISSGKYNNSSLDDFMEELLVNTTIEFLCQGNTKVLLRKKLVDKIPTPITIKGLVNDESTNELLSHGSVYLENMSAGTFTDENGNFELIIPSSDLNQNIVISFLGYQEKVISIAELQKNNKVSLSAQNFEIENVIISHSMPRMKTDLNDNAIVLDKKSFAANKANYLGGSDLLRSVQMLPGVSADDDASSDIKIRGSNADETMLLLDGMPIYNASHYYNVFSSIQSDYVDEVKLYRNIFPIQYSGVIAGLLKMDSDNFTDKLGGTFNVNTLHTSFTLSAPITEKISLNLGGRTSLGNVSQFTILNNPDEEFELSGLENTPTEFQNEVFQHYEPNFKFYDLNAKLSAQLTDASSLSFNLFHSNDFYNNEYDVEYQATTPNNLVQDFEEDFEFNHDWKNLAVGSNYHLDFNPNFSMDATFHLSNYTEEMDLNSTINVQTQGMPMNHATISTANNNEIQDIGINIAFVEKKKNQITFGFSANQYETKYKLYNDEQISDEVNSKAAKLTAFGAQQFNFKKLTLDFGTRATFYSGTYTARQDRPAYSNFFITPQLLATYRLNMEHALKFSVGRNNQFLREISYENRVGQTITIYDLADRNTIGVSDNIMLGYELKKGNWLFDVELFYKDIDGVLEFSNATPGFVNDMPGQQRPPQFRLFSGTGKSTGVDFLVNYQSKNYHTWIAYTLSKTTNQINALFNNEAYPNQNDRRHQLKWINNLKYKKFNFSFNTVLSSGKPYFALNLDGGNREEFDPELVYRNLPFYGRIDIGVNYNFKLFQQDAAFGVSCFNLTNRQNVKFNQQTHSIVNNNPNQGVTSTVVGSESELLNRTLDLNFKVRF